MSKGYDIKAKQYSLVKTNEISPKVRGVEADRINSKPGMVDESYQNN
jgi:hypothetical protein